MRHSSAETSASKPKRSRKVASVPPLFPEKEFTPQAQTLPELEQEIRECDRCLQLYSGWTQLVFGKGNTKADLVLVGEAPGAEEDKRGEPFVGRSGKLLTQLLQEAGLSRDDIYITNVVKIRPPNNKTPTPAEMAVYRPFLLRQLEIIHPKVILCLGKTATQGVLATEVPITKLRGQLLDFGKMKVMPTFHPAFLLRNPPMRRYVEEDIQTALTYLRGKKN